MKFRPTRTRVPLLLALSLAALGAAAARADDGGPKAAAEQQAQAQQQEKEAQLRLKEAQERLEEDARQVAQLSLTLSGEPGRIERQVRVVFERRAQLGMAIDMMAGAGTEAGVRVVSVSPNGPAAAAGLRANDRVVSLAGSALDGGDKDNAPHQLLKVMQGAKPGVPIAIEFRREGKLLKADIVPRQSPGPEADVEAAGLPELAMLEAGEGMPHSLGLMPLLRDAHGLGASQLVELSPGLGSYFGTDKGLLVVRAPPDARLRLQDGDVLLDIDGRVPAGVAHALQILGSYRSGETAHLHVMRQKQRTELAVLVPEG